MTSVDPVVDMCSHDRRGVLSTRRNEMDDTALADGDPLDEEHRAAEEAIRRLAATELTP